MSFAPAHFVGAQPAGDIFVPSTTQQHPLGMYITAVDEYWGGGVFVYGKAAQASGVGRLCFMTSAWAATDIPNTANTGYPIFVTKAKMAQDTYGWFQVAGYAPWLAGASVAAGTAFGITAAGTIGALAAGKQVLNARLVAASATNFTNPVTTQNGSPIITVASISGIFVGMAVSGTGIPGGTTVAAVNANNQVTMSANATATGTVTGTFTFTGFNGVQFNYPFVQGAIT